MIPDAIVTVNGIDLSCDVRLGVAIQHGRTDITGQPDPATANLELVATDRTLIDQIPINGVITIDAKSRDGQTTQRRFTGIITDVDMTWETTDHAAVRVIAASGVSILGRTFIGDEPWPLEDDGDRATRILSVVATNPYKSNFTANADGWTGQNGATVAWVNATIGVGVTWHTAAFEACSRSFTGLLPGGLYTMTATVNPGNGGIGAVFGGVAVGTNLPPNPGRIGTISVSGKADAGGTLLGQFWPYFTPANGSGAEIRSVTLTAQHQVPMGGIDPGTLNVLARDVDRQPCLALLQELAEDAGGLAWHTRDGAICYADADHRKNEPVAVTLDCSQILMAPQWSKTTAGVVNDATVTYGAASPQASQRTFDNPSIAAYGRMENKLTTQLAAAADASARASVLVIRGKTPVWNLPIVPLDLADPYLDGPTTAAVLGLELHALLAVTGLPSQGPATTAQLWVEGWEENIAAAAGVGSWAINLRVSDYCRTAPEPRWDDLADGWTWDTIPDIQWDQATCMQPPQSTGRWNDAPASTRWDTVDAATTWDGWT